MSKPIEPIRLDANGERVVMIPALAFDYIPRIRSEHSRKRMANGGLLDDDDSWTEIERIVRRVEDLRSRLRLNVYQPISNYGDDHGGPGDDEGLIDAGVNTLSGTVAGWSVFGNMISNVGNPKLAELVLNTVLGRTTTPNVASRSKQIKSVIDYFPTEDEAAAAAAQELAIQAEYGPAGYTGATGKSPGTPVGYHTMGPPLTQEEVEAIGSRRSEAYKQIDEEEALAALHAEHSTPEDGPPGGGDPGMTTGSGDEAPYGEGADEAAALGASGGLIKGYQEGAMVEGQADTTMDTAGLGPMGLVDDMAGDQVTGVEDDLNMEVEDGAYVLNADTVELVGLKDLNQLTKDAIDIAIESDIPLPKSVDPTQKVPIKISNGEFVIPAILVPIIGLENLEKMNKRGLEYREKNKEEAPPQEAQQQDIPVEPSEVPSKGVPGEINLAQGGALADQMNQLM